MRIIENNDIRAVRIMLESNHDGIIHFTNRNHYGFQKACELGHVEIIKLLLPYEEIDPTASKNFAIRIADVMGHTEIVNLLFNDHRIDHEALITDCENERMITHEGRINHKDLISRAKAHIRESKINEVLE
jgi:ankyrin repeat protein